MSETASPEIHIKRRWRPRRRPRRRPHHGLSLPGFVRALAAGPDSGLEGQSRKDLLRVIDALAVLLGLKLFLEVCDDGELNRGQLTKIFVTVTRRWSAGTFFRFQRLFERGGPSALVDLRKDNVGATGPRGRRRGKAPAHETPVERAGGGSISGQVEL